MDVCKSGLKFIVKLKLSLCLTKHHAMKSYSSTHSLTSALDGVSGQLHAPTALPPGKEPPAPSGWRLGGLQSHSGRGDEERNSQPPSGIEPRSSDRPARNQSLYRLSYKGSCFTAAPVASLVSELSKLTVRGLG
jgi:hypothetical protein